MTFLEKYDILKKSIPVPAVVASECIDSEFVDYTYRSKNCYFCFGCTALENGMFVYVGAISNRLTDCDFVVESEKCYECTYCTKCNTCTYLLDCHSSLDCHYSAFLDSCVNCFGCVGLTHKKYCIFNKQYSKDEYFKKIEELKKEKPEKILSQVYDLKRKIPHQANYQLNSENCLYGDYIYNSKNIYWSFNIIYAENSLYNYTNGFIKNCCDISFSGKKGSMKDSGCERCYELTDSGPSCYNCAFLNNCSYCTDCFYGENLKNCSDCFGCVGLTNKKYCVLNNQLTKEQYAKVLKEIKKELGWK